MSERKFKVGDRVRVNCPTDDDANGRIGHVSDIDDLGDSRLGSLLYKVISEDPADDWFVEGELEAIPDKFKVGDLVTCSLPAHPNYGENFVVTWFNNSGLFKSDNVVIGERTTDAEEVHFFAKDVSLVAPAKPVDYLGLPLYEHSDDPEPLDFSMLDGTNEALPIDDFEDDFHAFRFEMQLRHQRGRETYGNKSALSSMDATITDIQEELVDAANYLAYLHHKLEKLRVGVDIMHCAINGRVEE